MSSAVTVLSSGSATPGETARTRPAGGARAWIVWGVATACYVAALFHRASLGVAAPQAAVRFDAGPGLLALFSALQLGVYLVLQVPSGVAADRIGPRKVITGGVLAMAVGSAVFAVSGALLGGALGRILIGVGDAFMFINVLRVAAEWFPADRYGKIAALTGLAGGCGQLVATVPLSAALHGFGWETTFLAAGVITALLAVLVTTVVRDRPAVPVTAPPPVSRERIAVTLRAVSGLRGTRHAFWVHFVLMSQFLALTALWGAPWLTEAQGRSAAGAGTLLMAAVGAFVVSGLLVGQFVAGRPRRRESVTAGLSWAVGVAWLLMVVWPAPLPHTVLVALLIVIGVGGGASMLAFDGARAVNPGHRSGTASGVVNMGGFSACVLIQLLVGAVLQQTGWLPPAEAYRWAFVPVVVLIVAGTLAQLTQRIAHR